MKWPPKTDGHVILSIVLLVHICSQHPWTGNAHSNHAIGFIGISPPSGSLEGALLCCDGPRSALGRGTSIIIPSAGHCHRWMCVPSSEPGGQKLASAHVACRSSRQQKESKRCAEYSIFKEQRRAEKSPLAFHAEKRKGWQPNYFKFFAFRSFARIWTLRLWMVFWDTRKRSATARSLSRWS